MERDWQNCDSIIKSNEMMLNHQLACDINFLVGKEQSCQGAHKYVLVSRSPVFEAMLCGPASDQEVKQTDIAIPDTEPQYFHAFLRYLYCGDTEIKVDNVINILYCAKKYAISGLVNKCLAFVEDLLDPQNACALLEQAHFFDERQFHEKVLAVILRKAEEVLGTDDICQLCEICLGEIISSDSLICSEDLVLTACKKWSEAECGRRGLAVNDSNCRIMLGNNLYKIRFPLLTPNVFVTQLVQGNLLNEQEKVDVMSRFIIPSRVSSFFPTSQRIKQRQNRFNRFQERSEAAFNNQSGTSALTFEINKDINIEGFTIYGACRAASLELQVCGRILDPEEKIMCSVETSVVTSSKQDLYDVIFDESARLRWGVKYTLLVDIIGSRTFAGHNGRLAVFCSDTVFTFHNTERSQTGTSVTHGQLPGLIFSH